jgi:SAM-dependent methyltransferase
MPASAEMIAQLEVVLNENPDSGESSRYIREMWMAALHSHLQGEAAPSHGLSDALPYVPVPEGYIDLNDGGSVLDVGTLGGYGLFDFVMRSGGCLDGLRIVGLDIDSRSVDIGRKMAEVWAAGRNVSFEVCDAAKTSFPDRSFDIIVSRLVLPYVPYRPMIAENSRILSDGGSVLYQWHSMDYYLERLRGAAGLKRLYYGRVILAGLVSMTTGIQSKCRRFVEIPLAFEQVEKTCRRHSLRMVWKGGSKRKPMALFVKGL